MSITYTVEPKSLTEALAPQDFAQLLAAHPSALMVPAEHFAKVRTRISNLISLKYRDVWSLGSSKRHGALTLNPKMAGPCPCGDPSCQA